MSNVRNSNLELYRIIVMLLIVAHHYVVNSGLVDVMAENVQTALSADGLFRGGKRALFFTPMVIYDVSLQAQSDMGKDNFLRLSY